MSEHISNLVESKLKKIKEEKNVFDLFAHSIVGAKEHGYLESGDTVVITSGVPIGKSGTTNMMKVDTVH